LRVGGIIMTRSEFREKVVELLYIQAMGGDYDETAYDLEIIERFRDVLTHIEEINNIISSNLIGYTIDRLNFVDLAIIQNAVYELKVVSLEKEIVINEAIELTKKYSNLDDDSAKRFNNKLLDNITKSLNK